MSIGRRSRFGDVKWAFFSVFFLFSCRIFIDPEAERKWDRLEFEKTGLLYGKYIDANERLEIDIGDGVVHTCDLTQNDERMLSV